MFHEESHKVLHTKDIKYEKEEREKGVKRPLIDNMSAYEKQNNADNWRKFYSEVLK